MKLNAPKFYEVVKAGNTGQETTVSPKIYVRTLWMTPKIKTFRI